MPARSEKQQELMAIAEHHPSEVSAKNKGVLKMSHQQLHDFAATKGLRKKNTDLINHVTDHIMKARRTDRAKKREKR